MKLTAENFKDYVPENQQGLFEGLLIDLMELNQMLEDCGMNYMKVYFDIKLDHDEYSPERTEPCPDYYYYYTIRFENNNNITVGEYMAIDDLDNAMLILYNFVEHILQ